MEKKNRRIIFNKSGGNASKNAVGAKISIPKSWLDKMKVSEEERDVIMTFKDDEILIKKE